MKVALIVALLSFFAFAQDTEDSVVAVLRDAYNTCVLNYVRPRINWNATPGDLADGAAGNCAKERNAISESLRSRGMDLESSMRVSDRVVYGYRLALIAVILELRNNPPAK